MAHTSIHNAVRTLGEFAEDTAGIDRITHAARRIAKAFQSGNKVLACGNGGSSADAMHFCEELTGRFRDDRPAMPAIACVDPGHITCTANDYGYDRVFSRWVEALGTTGDVLIAISTSGNSKNVVLATEAARERGMSVITLLGKTGGELKGTADHEWIVPGETTDRIQELHMLILHCLVEEIEREMGYA